MTPKHLDLRKLPAPTREGNYYIWESPRYTFAIFPIKGHKDQAGKFFLLLGPEGVKFGRDNRLFAYDTPQQAFAVMREELFRMAREKKL